MKIGSEGSAAVAADVDSRWKPMGFHKNWDLYQAEQISPTVHHSARYRILKQSIDIKIS